MNEQTRVRVDTAFERGASIKVSMLADDDLAFLQRVLDQLESSDPYQGSATYYAMTGRRGLWIAHDNDAAIIFCRHPNIDDVALVFPPIGDASTELYEAVLSAAQKECGQVLLARAEMPPVALAASPNLSVQRVREEHLDWTYPVHTVDTCKLVGHKGNEFQQFRTALNKLDRTKLLAIDLDPVENRGDIGTILDNWSGSDEEKLAPYERLLSLHRDLPLNGRLIFYDGRPAGFSIWEETDPEGGLANAFAHVGIHDVPGMSRFVILDMCEVLQARGFHRVCVGGSETPGLDQFKRQLRPVQSTVVGSYVLSPMQQPAERRASAAPNSATAINARQALVR